MKRPFKDHYETLGVSRDATGKQVRKARNKLLRKHHPDRNPDRQEEAERITIDILLASDVLLDESKREEYDRFYDLNFGRPRGGKERDGEVFSVDEEEEIVCPHCGRLNLMSSRGYCIICGGGIGENPRPYEPHRFHVDFGKYRARSVFDPFPVMNPDHVPYRSRGVFSYGVEGEESILPIVVVVLMVVLLFVAVLALEFQEDFLLFFLVALLVAGLLIGVFLFLKIKRSLSKRRRKK
jgi:hypothetical protein